MTEVLITDQELLEKAGVMTTTARAVMNCYHLEEMSALVTTVKRATQNYDDLMLKATKQRDAELNNVGALLA